MPRTVRRHTTSVEMQTLEDRRMLAAFGTPWPDARNLTISIPNDNVQVGKYQNEIERTLDQVATRQQWQELVLRAYQTWAINADVNIGLRNDYNLPFGTQGLTTGDPRFGEFRIGAFPQQGPIASAVPFQAVAGTYSGELLLNSSEQFRYHDWDGQVGPDPAMHTASERDLFSIFLHESGNTLGIADNSMEWSVMFGQYTVPKGVLAPEDIASIQSLYGARSDPYEQVDNGQLQSADLIPTPVGLDLTADVIRTRGSLVTGADVDHYKVVPAAGFDNATIRLRAAGVSLLKSRMEVTDDVGNVLQSASAASVFDNDNVIQLSGIQNLNSVYIRVTAEDPSDVYSVGDYELEVDYRTSVVQASDPVGGAYDSGEESVFANFGLNDDEAGTNDNIGNAIVLDPLTGVSTDRYEIESSVSSSTDVDVWKFTAPTSTQGRLVTHVSSVGLDAPDVRIKVLDSSGNNVVTAGRLRPDGTWTMEVAQPIAGEDYYLRVSVDPTSTVGSGNYVALAEFEASSTQMNHLVSGDVSDSVDDFITWSAGETKLYRFDLSAANGASNEGVRVTIYDAHTKNSVMTAVTRAGVSRSALAWLQQGDYILRFTAISGNTNPAMDVNYTLMVDGISDDQDDNGDDGNDPYNYYYYYGPGYYGYGYWYNGYYYYY